MILIQDEVTKFWLRVKGEPNLQLRAHEPWDCVGPLCDVHNRRGEEPWASWPLVFRADRAMMEILCKHGIGHPTPAQCAFWHKTMPSIAESLTRHGCDGCCEGAYHQIKEN